MATKRKAVDDQQIQERIFTSQPLLDRSSKFIALFSPTLDPRTLQSHPSLRTATHRVLAWRHPSPQRTIQTSSRIAPKQIYVTASDDDGEAYAGRKLERVLEGLGVQGAVVVARWFGGVMLGAVRFVHFEAVAREAVGLWREFERGKREAATGGEGGKDEVNAVKRVKVGGDDESVQRERLARQLEQRDQSIVVLRGLLAEKTKGGGSQTSNLSSSSSSTKVSGYTGMTLDQLEKVEKARDTTIAWLLKKIEAAEKVAGRDDDGAQDDNKMTAKSDQLGSVSREIEAPEGTSHRLVHGEATAEDHG